MTITGTFKTMQEQNAIFEHLEPNKFIRVLKMADDIRQRTREEYKKREGKRMEKYNNDERDQVWKNNR